MRRGSAPVLAVLGAYDVEEVGQLHYDVAEVGLAEVVALRVAVDVAQAVIVARLQLEVPHLGVGILQSQSGGDAVVELVFDGHRVLRHHRAYAVGEVGVLHVEVCLRLLAQAEAYLRPGLEEELKALLLPAPPQVGEHRYLHIAHRAAVLLGQARHLVHHGRVVRVEDALLPPYLRVVHLGLHRADGVKVFLADVAEGESARHAAVEALVHLRGEAHAAQHVAAVHAYAQVVAVLAHLRRGPRRGEQHHQKQYLAHTLLWRCQNFMMDMDLSRL